MNEKQSPFDLEAEEAVLGSLLIDSEALSQIDGLLTPEDFYRDKNRWVYAAILGLREKKQGIDMITVSHQLQEKLEAVGGSAYLSHLVSQVPTSVHIAYYAGIVAECAWHRRLMAFGEKATEAGRTGKAKEKIEALTSELAAFCVEPKGSTSAFELAERAGERYDKLYRGEVKQSIPYGLKELDRITGGAYFGELILVGARTQVGKTEFLKTLALNMEPYGLVLLVSLEMTEPAMMDRIIGTLACISANQLRRGKYSDAVNDAILEAQGKLSEMKLRLYTQAHLTTRQIEAEARRLQLRGGLSAIIVDYIQLLADSPPRASNREQEVAYISKRLKGMALDLDVVVIAASQLSRESIKGPPRPPRLTDFRESGALEQDADVAILMHRPDADYSAAEWKQKSLEEGWTKEYPKGEVNTYLAKLRQGGTNERRPLKIRWDEKRQVYCDA